MGTPAYMAPEIALGHANVDGRADIYSLGCVAYYLLTGQHVFSGDTPLATALAHVKNAPVPPRLRSEFSVPPALALIMECLAKDPAARPAAAAIMSKRLAATVAADAWTSEAAETWWERHQPLTEFSSADPDGWPETSGRDHDRGRPAAQTPAEDRALKAVNTC